MSDEAIDLKKQVTDYLTSVFPQTDGNEGWSLRVSMPFPQFWNGQPTPIIWYAYADRTSPQSPNGVEVSEAWATVTHDVGHANELQVTWLQQGIVPLGFQGARPLSQADLQAARASAGNWLTMTSGEPSPGLKASAQFWRKIQGVFFNSVAPNHPEFVQWLNEP